LVFRISVFLHSLALLTDPVAQRRVRWTPLAAGTAAVLMAWDPGCALQVRFRDAQHCMGSDFRRRRRTGKTYNGLLKALERQQSTVLPTLKADLRMQAKRRYGTDPLSGWLLMAVDGSKEDLPRTKDHEQVFGVADNGVCPQAFLTVIVEVHTGLLWDWRIGPARASEKFHLMEMSGDLPQEALLLADGAFVGLPIWSQLNAQGKHFLIRVGGNVRLITQLWPDALTRREGAMVYVWPKKSQKTQAPLPLRLIQVGSGPKAVYLLTNVLDPQRLSRKSTGAIYRQRWGVELLYRTFKRTFGYAKLRSKAGRRAMIELEWALVAMNIATMMGIDALTRRHRHPDQLSSAQSLGALRRSLLQEGTDDRKTPMTLERTLGHCLKDSYQRHTSKQSRHRLVTTNTPKHVLQPPILRTATEKERQLAQKYQPATAA